jgi:hypothetical protein
MCISIIAVFTILPFIRQVASDQNYIYFTSMLIIFQIKACSHNKKNLRLYLLRVMALLSNKKFLVIYRQTQRNRVI